MLRKTKNNLTYTFSYPHDAQFYFYHKERKREREREKEGSNDDCLRKKTRNSRQRSSHIRCEKNKKKIYKWEKQAVSYAIGIYKR